MRTWPRRSPVRAKASQEVAHRQLAGEAPLTNIVMVLKEKLPEMAKQAGVHAIAEQGKFDAEGCETKDVTKALTGFFTQAPGWEEPAATVDAHRIDACPESRRPRSPGQDVEARNENGPPVPAKERGDRGVRFAGREPRQSASRVTKTFRRS